MVQLRYNSLINLDLDLFYLGFFVLHSLVIHSHIYIMNKSCACACHVAPPNSCSCLFDLLHLFAPSFIFFDVFSLLAKLGRVKEYRGLAASHRPLKTTKTNNAKKIPCFFLTCLNTVSHF